MLHKKILVLAAAACLAMAGIRTATAGDAHLFILSGQSNMAILYEPTFTGILERVLPAEDVIVVKDAEGGAPILRWYKDWEKAPDAPDPVVIDTAWPGYYGDLYDRMMARVDSAVAGRTLASVTFVWMQGEEDANVHIYGGAVYEQSLHGLLNQLKTDLGYADLNVVIGRINDAGLLNPVRVAMMPDCRAVRDAQVAVAESSPRYAWVDTDLLNDPGDGLHNNTTGMGLLIQMFMDKALELLMQDVDGMDAWSYLTLNDTGTAVYCPDDADADSVFTDDFADSNFAADPALAHGNARGLGWEQPDQDADFTLRVDTLRPDPSIALIAPYNSTEAKAKDLFIRALPGSGGNAWKRYAVDYRVYNRGTRSDMGSTGLMLLMNGYDDYYLFSSTFSHAVMYRVMTDSAGSTSTTPLFACTELETPSDDFRLYRVIAAPRPDGIRFYIGCGTDSAAARTVKRVCIDTDPRAVARFNDGGGIGFFKNYPTTTGHQRYDDISVKVFSFADNTVTTAVRSAPTAAAPGTRLSSRIVTDRLTVTTDRNAAITVFDAAGHSMAAGRGGRLVWEATGAAAGTYYVRIGNGNSRTVERVLKTE